MEESQGLTKQVNCQVHDEEYGKFATIDNE
jgi:hypothetical protein